ncbi:hypothetical protein [Paenibacillus pedocola]|nr:hypothetical protein [Paenibacillus typhae]
MSSSLIHSACFAGLLTPSRDQSYGTGSTAWLSDGHMKQLVHFSCS